MDDTFSTSEIEDDPTISEELEMDFDEWLERMLK